MLSQTDIKQNDFTLGALGQSRQMVRWVYEHSTGDISEPQEIGDQYVVAMVTAVNKAGTLSVSEARPFVESIIRNEKKAKLIKETKFKGNTLESYSASSGAPILRADSLVFSAQIISGIGSEPKIMGAVFNRAFSGKLIEPIAGATGVFALKEESTGAKQSAQDIESFKQNLIRVTQAGIYRSQDALRKAAVIKDSRSKFY